MKTPAAPVRTNQSTMRFFMNARSLVSIGFIVAVAAGSSGCASVKHIAVNKMGDALAGGGTTFASDDDPELVKTAVPFSLKLMESLLAESPNHQGLLLAASSGFTQYSYAFVQQDAEEMEDRDVAASIEMRNRARRLYLRARDYGLRGLEASHPGFTNKLRSDSKSAVSLLTKKDVPMTYWAAVSWCAAVGVLKNNTDLIAELPLVEALIDRALVLDEAYDHGAIHSFLITYETVRPEGQGEAAARARSHFEKAVQLSEGKQAGPYVSLAENVAIPAQNRNEFESLLNQALAIDPDAKPEFRLANLLMQHRARWLLTQEDNLIAREDK
jgi:predicted anti-sigma-YlaC factor YlaD